jgi:hypothetical protein
MYVSRRLFVLLLIIQSLTYIKADGKNTTKKGKYPCSVSKHGSKNSKGSKGASSWSGDSVRKPSIPPDYGPTLSPVCGEPSGEAGNDPLTEIIPGAQDIQSSSPSSEIIPGAEDYHSSSPLSVPMLLVGNKKQLPPYDSSQGQRAALNASARNTHGFARHNSGLARQSFLDNS